MGSVVDDFKDDPLKSKDPFGGGGGAAQADPFSSEDPFKSSKFWYKTCIMERKDKI